MKIDWKEAIQQAVPLALILFVVISGFTLLVTRQSANDNFQQLTEKQVENSIAEKELADTILNNLNQLVALFHKILVAGEINDQILLRSRAEQLIKQTDHCLTILTQGGSLAQIAEESSNAAGTTRSYKPKQNHSFHQEVASLRPLLTKLQQNFGAALAITTNRNERLKTMNFEGFNPSAGNRIIAFAKENDPVFSALIQQANQLALAANNEYVAQYKNIDRARQRNQKSTITFTYVTIGTVLLIIGYIHRQTFKNSRIHQALQESEKRFRDVTNSLSEALIVLDQDLNIQLMNRAAEEKYVASPTDYVGKSCREIFFNCKDNCDTCPSLRTLKEAQIVETKCNLADGTILDRVFYPIQDAQGNVVACTIVATDITAQETNLQQLQRAEQIISTSTDYLALIDSDHRYLAVNKAFADFFNRSSEEIVGQHVSDVIGPQNYRQITKKRYDRCLQGESQTFQTWINYPVAGLRHIDVTYTPYQTKNNDITGLVIRLIDITEKSEQEAKLKLSATFFESTTEGIIITDPGGNTLTVNPAFTAITGYTETDILYKNPRLLKSTKHDAQFYAQMWHDLKENGRWQGEIWNLRKTGEIYPQLTSISCVKSSSGEILNYVSVFSDISKIKAAVEQLEHQAHHHPLTQLPNRLLLHARLDHSLQRAQREHSLGAVFYIDIDNFKNVNDSLGHAAGDEVLIEVAKRFQQQTRKVDTVAHLSGDEFVLVMEQVHSIDAAAKRAEQLLKSLQQPFSVLNYELFLSGSIGISLFPTDGESVEKLLKNADSAMYRAKDAGKNGYRIYSPDITEAALERVLLESQLRRALDNNELKLFYQPQLALPHKEIVAFEALVRWEHPESGLMPPNKFIPLAEETGLIIPMGEWILRTACQQFVKWQQQGHKLQRIAVNLSGKQIQQKNLLQMVKNILHETGCPAAALELEITEGFIMQHPEQTIAVLQQIRAIGVELSVDDFGTGHSSLNYLKRLPINRLKIDRSFVADIHLNPEGEAITRTIIAMGHNLNMQITAEGIETEQQCEFLSQHGCNEAQGFLFSKPQPAHTFDKLLPAKKQSPHLLSGKGIF